MKHDRFRNLEGETPGAAEAVDQRAPKVSERFAAVDVPKDRAGLEIDPRDARGQRAHLRCIECAHENGNYADACEKCHATLLTRAVHRLNVRLHQDEQAAELARHAAEPVGHVEELIVRAPVEQRTLLDRVAMRLPIASLMLARAVVVGAIAGACGLLYLATGWGVLGFLFGLIVTLGLCLVVT